MSKHQQGRPHPRATVVEGHPKLYVMVGLPAAGKTTLARRIEIEYRALRFTPDEWMIPLFGESMANGKRNVLEGRFIATALSAPEPVKADETSSQDFFCASLSMVGLLIHAAVGSLGGLGLRFPNRQGLAA